MGGKENEKENMILKNITRKKQQMFNSMTTQTFTNENQKTTTKVVVI